MEKALEILNNLTHEDIWTLQQINLEHEQLYKAIAELEEAMNKTCEWYTYCGTGRKTNAKCSLNVCDGNYCDSNGNFTNTSKTSYCSFHKPKDTQ